MYNRIAEKILKKNQRFYFKNFEYWRNRDNANIQLNPLQVQVSEQLIGDPVFDDLIKILHPTYYLKDGFGSKRYTISQLREHSGKRKE